MSTPVGRVKRQPSRTQASMSVSNVSLTASVTASAPTPIEVRLEEVGSSSESEASLPAKGKTKEILMQELSKISIKADPNVPSVMNIPLMQKIRNVLRQEDLDMLTVKVRFGNIDLAAWKVVVQFRRELSTNEAHSYAYLLPHEDFNVTQNQVRAKGKDLRAHGFYSDPLMLFENVSANVDSVHNTMCYVRRCEA